MNYALTATLTLRGLTPEQIGTVLRPLVDAVPATLLSGATLNITREETPAPPAASATGTPVA